MKRTQNILILLLLTLAVSCQKPKARKPISQMTTSFLKESSERTKKILERENESILAYIKQDTANNYQTSKHGFWYSYIKQDTLNNPTPLFGNKVNFNYSISHLNNGVIYSQSELGDQTYYIDQQDIIIGLREGLKLMKSGEQMKFIFPSQMAYGYTGDRKKIDVNTPIICHVTLHNISKQ